MSACAARRLVDARTRSLGVTRRGACPRRGGTAHGGWQKAQGIEARLISLWGLITPRGMRRATPIAFFLLTCACTGSTSGKGDAKTEANGQNVEDNGVPNGSTNGNRNDGANDPLRHYRCPGLSFSHDGECVLPDARVSVSVAAVEGVPQEWEQSFVCRETLADEELALGYTVGEVLDETENCRVVYRDPDVDPNWGYTPGRTDFGAVTVTGGGESHSLFSRENAWDGCLTTEPGTGSFGQFDTEYLLEIAGGEDAPPFSTSMIIPTNPKPNCPQVEPGDAVAVEWTTGGAEYVELTLDGREIEIRCTVEDSGRFVIGAELTAQFEEGFSPVLRITKTSFEPYYDEESNTWVLASASAGYSCFDEFR